MPRAENGVWLQAPPKNHLVEGDQEAKALLWGRMCLDDPGDSGVGI